MNNNDVLRRLRYALDLNDADMHRLFAAAGHPLPVELLHSLLKKEDEPGFRPLDSQRFGDFLDALITDRRGARDPDAPPVRMDYRALSNNDILKKLRIALNMRQDDMLQALKLGGQEVSPSELSALFRKPGHKHYRACGDQFLRNFLHGLTTQLRK